MTNIEKKRFEYIKLKDGYNADKTEFLVRTGLTFDPETKKMVNGEEKAYKDIDWYYPKGAAFKNSDESGDGSNSGSSATSSDSGSDSGSGSDDSNYSEVTVTYADVANTMTQEEFDAIDKNGDGQIVLRPSVDEDGNIMKDENGDVIYVGVPED